MNYEAIHPLLRQGAIGEIPNGMQYTVLYSDYIDNEIWYCKFKDVEEWEHCEPDLEKLRTKDWKLIE